MNNKNLILAFFFIFLLILQLFYQTKASTESSIPGLEEAAFYIPIFPGTKLFEPSSSNITISPPYTTITFILQADKGKTLDPIKVIEFYKNALIKKGWKESEALKPGSKESCLALQCRFYNPDIGQNLTGQFHVYVAAQDGLITLYLRQWRNSYAGQKITDLFNRLKKELTEIEKEIYLKYNSSGKLARWEYFFEDENFLEGIYYNWTTEESPYDIIEVMVAIYTDAQAAQKAKESLSSKYKLTESKDNILIIVQSYLDRPSESTKNVKELIFNRVELIILTNYPVRS